MAEAESQQCEFLEGLLLGQKVMPTVSPVACARTDLSCHRFSPLHLADACPTYSRERIRLASAALPAVHLITFADQSLASTFQRIRSQATDFPFSTITTLTESDLDVTFRGWHQDYLGPSSRGYGYYLWKPEVVLAGLQAIPEGETLLYIDAGCHLHDTGLQRFADYRSYLALSVSGVLAFQHRPNESDWFDTIEIPPDILDGPYTKGEVLVEFPEYREKKYMGTPGLQSGIFFLRNTSEQRDFIREWQHVARTAPALFTDDFDPSSQRSGFVAPRHDQTIFSLIAKRRGAETLSAWETWLPGMASRKNSSFADSPIVARRDLPSKSRKRPGWSRTLFR